ncbi:MAG TPA: Eco29kI family restriction endonuclease [Sedimentisphaerales bacterium]|nr:Eco29kI family restriction endonuclease [Sedimentisphaerales bacterium]
MQAYDPLHYDNLARSVVEALLGGPEVPLPPPEPFDGAGVYAIYYHGNFDGYSPLVKAEKRPPIYVGKAVPGGARKGARCGGTRKELFQRLKEHSESIAQAENLDGSDFTCRHLVVVPVWITLAERFLIEYYQPVWNVAIDGFGNHAPGKGRIGMKRPRWDILHPGRPWAAKLEAQESQELVLQRLFKFLTNRK